MIKEILLFPGVVFHEISHYLMCLIMGVKVKKVKISFYGGSVEHVVPKSIIESILISIAPCVFAISFSVVLINIFLENPLYELVKFYFVFVMLYVSTPSKADTDFMKHHSTWQKVLAFPLFLIVRFYYYASHNEYTKVIFSLTVIIIILLSRIILITV